MPEKPLLSAAELLRELRIERGQSVRNAASQLGIAASHLSRIERGERSVSEAVGKKLGDFYGIGQDLVLMSEGRLPQDILDIFKKHPDLIEELRRNYGTDQSKMTRNEGET
ncbi:MAG: helix-turn-helix domain-containing protein [Actinomycetota bacterium]